MGADKKKQMGVLGLVIALVVVLFGSLLFVGAVAGWFDDPKTVLDAEYTCEDENCEYTELDANGYEGLIAEKKSFIVFVDQPSCTTADRLREYVSDWAAKNGVKVYRMMFSEVKESSLHDHVKYYPSVVVVDKGTVRAYLKADSDEDAQMYNDYEAFEGWMGRYL